MYDEIMSSLVSISFPLLIVSLIIALAVLTRELKNNLIPAYVKKLETQGKLEQARLVEDIAKAAVAYAEQVEENNAERKQAAMEYMNEQLALYGIELTEDEISKVIEQSIPLVKTLIDRLQYM